MSFDPFSGSDRGQSQLVGFLLVTALILAGSVIGGIMGIDALSQATSGQPIHAAESSMTNVQSDLYDLSGGAPHRTTDVEVTDGRLTYGENVTITVEATSSNGTMETQAIKLRPLVYGTGDARMVVSGGAVFLEQDGGVVMKSEPSYRIGQEQAIVPLLEARHKDGPSSIGIGGDGTIYVVSYNWDTRMSRYEPVDSEDNALMSKATITIQSPRAAEWAAYYRDDPRFTTVSYDEATNTVSTIFESRRIFIRTTEAHIRYDS